MDESGGKNDLEKRIEIIEKTLVGDLSSQRAGVMQNMLRLMEEIYDQENGLKPRLERVERSRMQIAAYAAGAGAAVMLIWKLAEKAIPVVLGK